MKTIQPATLGSSLYQKIELHSESNFFHEISDRSFGDYADHHHPENVFLHHTFEDEYDNYNSDFDLDTK